MPISGGSAPPPAQFSAYHHEEIVVAGAYYVPAAKTIIMMSKNFMAQKIDIYEGNDPVKIGTESLGATEKGYIGCIYCDGTGAKFKNTDAAQQQLAFRGLSMT